MWDQSSFLRTDIIKERGSEDVNWIPRSATLSLAGYAGWDAWMLEVCLPRCFPPHHYDWKPCQHPIPVSQHTRMFSQAAILLSATPPPSTKTPFKIHTGCCRVRRKRKRLTSNGSIESDAAVRRRTHPGFVAPHHFR
jgi:hypothetical protein